MTLVRRDHKEKLALRVRKARQARPVTLAPAVLWGMPVRPDLPDQWVIRDPPAIRVHKEALARLVAWDRSVTRDR